jgi:hypothetical protein
MLLKFITNNRKKLVNELQSFHEDELLVSGLYLIMYLK